MTKEEIEEKEIKGQLKQLIDNADEFLVVTIKHQGNENPEICVSINGNSYSLSAALAAVMEGQSGLRSVITDAYHALDAKVGANGQNLFGNNDVAKA